MKNIVISSIEQYGYLIDTYKYCEKLKENNKITYVCFDYGFEKIEDELVDVIYLPKEGSLIKRMVNLNRTVAKVAKRNKCDLIFNVYNPLVFITKLLTLGKRNILDIRTGSIDPVKENRDKANKRILFNSKFFSEVTIISQSLAELLKIKDYTIIPLGGDRVSKNITKNLDKIRLLYVGVLADRKIIDTVIAFNKFVEKYSDLDIEYDIIGYFMDENSKEAKEFFSEVNKNQKINYLGRKKHEELEKYFNKANVGVSYIPMTEYYDVQPPTKTFEYLSQGLITIATNTSENKRVVNKNNGILCDDNSDSFYDALEILLKERFNFKTDYLRESVKEYSWDYIIDNKLIPIIEK